MAGVALALYLVWILVAFVARSVIQQRATGDTGIRDAWRQAPAGSTEWWAGWSFVVALVLGFVAPVAELAGYDPLTTNGTVRGVGLVLAVVGIGGTFAAQMNMGSEWRIGVDPNEQTGLVLGGAYRVVRNPIFTAMIVAAIGLAMMVPNPASVLGAVLLVVAVELQVRGVEEPHLLRLHGDRYRAYAARVGRLVPGLGRI